MSLKRSLQLSDLLRAEFGVRCSTLPLQPRRWGKAAKPCQPITEVGVTETSNAELRTPNLERKSNTSAAVVPDRAESCRVAELWTLNF